MKPLQHERQAVFDIRNREAHDPDAGLLERSLSLRIHFLSTAMGGAIDLDNEAVFGTEEVDDETAHLVLPSPLRPS